MTTSFPVPDAPLSLSELREVLDSNIGYFDELENQPDGGLDALMAEYSSEAIDEYDPNNIIDGDEPDGLTELGSNFLTSLLQEVARKADDKPFDEDYFSVTELIELGFTRTNIERFLTDITEDENYQGIRKDDETSQPIQGAPKLGHSPRDPEKYYSINEVTRAMANPELVAWLAKTKEARAKKPKDTNRLVSQAVGAVITLDASPYSLKRKQNDNTYSHGFLHTGQVGVDKLDTSGKVPLLQVMTQAVADWNKLYTHIIPKELHGVIDDYNKKHSYVPSRTLMTPLFAHFPKSDVVMMNRVHVVTVRAIRDDLTSYPRVAGTFTRLPAKAETEHILRLKTLKLIIDTYPQLAKAAQYVFFSKNQSAWAGLTKDNVRNQRISDDIRAELQALLEAK